MVQQIFFFFFSSRRRHTRLQGDWSSDVCSSDLGDRDHDLEQCFSQLGNCASNEDRKIGRASCRKSVDLGGRRIIKKKKKRKKKKENKKNKKKKKKKKIKKN